jgi:hypothetical protein
LIQAPLTADFRSPYFTSFSTREINGAIRATARIAAPYRKARTVPFIAAP